MTKNILITGVRTPVSLALLNNLTDNGYQVYCADSCQYPIIRFSKLSNGYSILPSPRFQLDLFKKKLIAICQQHHIDLIIPLCEEIFYIAQIANKLPEYTEVFCDDFNRLASLHHKQKILQMAEGLGVQIPKTALLTTETPFEKTQHAVIKRIYSRFGSACYKNISLKHWHHLKKMDCKDWILQQFIPGDECCSYSIAFQGKVLAHTAYVPKHRLYGSAAIYFDPIEDQEIRHFCEQFIQKYNFTGQIAFDFIRNQDGLYILECNPRATSGLFLLTHHDLASVLVNKKMIEPSAPSPKMLAVAMLTHGVLDAFKQRKIKGWQEDFKAGHDVLKKCQLKRGTNLLIFTIAIFSLLMGNQRFRKQTTEDIEYPPIEQY